MARLLSLGLLGKLGPYQVPVVGAKVVAGDCTTCGAFDGDAAMDWNGAIASEPIRHVGCIAADLGGKARLCATALRCEVIGEFHLRYFSESQNCVYSVLRIYLFSIALSNLAMTDIDEIRRGNLRAIELEFGGPAGAAKRLGMSNSQFTNLRDGAKDSKTGKPRGMRKETARRIEAAAGKPSGWLDIDHQDRASHGIAPVLSPASTLGVPAVYVPLLANAGSMGKGSELQHDDVLVGHISLAEQWVARRLQPSSAEALRFIHAYGDSMHPTFEDGDVLLVDTGMRDPTAIDGVYVMSVHDRIYIKRVRQRMDGSIEVSSDNPTVKTVDVLNGDHAVQVLGRVIWCWNGRKM